jgi:hypothetical protein
MKLMHVGVCSSYVVDPEWQAKFSIIWASLVGLAVLISLPHLLRSIKNQRAFTGVLGVWEDLNARYYERVPPIGDLVSVPESSGRAGKVNAVMRTLKSVTFWSLPGLGLNAGQSTDIYLFFLCMKDSDGGVLQLLSSSATLSWCCYVSS